MGVHPHSRRKAYQITKDNRRFAYLVIRVRDQLQAALFGR